MKYIAISQRVDINPDYGERRDALDQNWIKLIQYCGFIPLVIPNSLETVKSYVKDLPIYGVLLTGGNSPVSHGGDAIERDEVEAFLVKWSLNKKRPLLGVCRGMQSIQLAFDNKLEPVDGHISEYLTIFIESSIYPKEFETNSYHNLGSKHCKSPLLSWAKTDDGVVKAVKHEEAEIYGIMWHPERHFPFDPKDILLFKKIFNN